MNYFQTMVISETMKQMAKQGHCTQRECEGETNALMIGVTMVTRSNHKRPEGNGDV